MQQADYVFLDPISRRVHDRLLKIASKKDGSVLITGPTGTGKEVAARLVHENSPRNGAPFVAAHCGALPRELFESLFFGHVRGAFTGAVRDHNGYFIEANGGTLFLDEVGELLPEHQQKLLRVLDGYPFRRVGEAKDISNTDVRIVAATNRDIRGLIRSNDFRADLYARLSFFEVTMPALDQRPKDVGALAKRFAIQLRPNDRTGFVDAVENAAQRLSTYPGAWPLGIRRIRAFVARADCFGVRDAERSIRREWQGAASATRQGAQVHKLSRTTRDHEALAGLISAKLGGKKLSPAKGERSKPMLAASHAQALAELFLAKPSVSLDEIAAALGGCQKKTLTNNVKALKQTGLIHQEASRVSVLWPPITARLYQWSHETWLPVSEGTIPLGRTGDRFAVEVATELEIQACLVVVTHGRADSARSPWTTKKDMAPGTTTLLAFELDEQPGFEQALLHLSWPTHKSASEVNVSGSATGVPTSRLLADERARLINDLGHGWIEEFLVHHLASDDAAG